MTLADTVTEVLKSRKHNRHKATGNIRQNVEYALQANAPVKIFGYWGIMGKSETDDIDSAALDILREIQDRVQDIYSPGIDYTLIITDTHAHLNGFKTDDYQDYVNGLKDLFSQSGIKFDLLSDHYVEYSDKHEIPEELKGSLVKSAKKVYDGNPETGANLYYNARRQEALHFERHFPDSIFFTYNHPKYQPMLPDLPTLYLRSGPGTSRPPWMPKHI